MSASGRTLLEERRLPDGSHRVKLLTYTRHSHFVAEYTGWSDRLAAVYNTVPSNTADALVKAGGSAECSSSPACCVLWRHAGAPRSLYRWSRSHWTGTTGGERKNRIGLLVRSQNYRRRL
jgi:hypothetical protein